MHFRGKSDTYYTNVAIVKNCPKISDEAIQFYTYQL